MYIYWGPNSTLRILQTSGGDGTNHCAIEWRGGLYCCPCLRYLYKHFDTLAVLRSGKGELGVLKQTSQLCEKESVEGDKDK